MRVPAGLVHQNARLVFWREARSNASANPTGISGGRGVILPKKNSRAVFLGRGGRDRVADFIRSLYMNRLVKICPNCYHYERKGIRLRRETVCLIVNV